MKAMQHLVVLSLMALLTSACVTIHIYFPAAAAEEAARVIVREVLQTPDDVPAAEPQDAPEPTSRRGAPAGLSLLAMALDRVVAPAAAQQSPDLRIETPATDRIRASMRARNADLAPHLRSGAVGFGNDGFVAVRDLSAVPLRDRGQVQRLVNEENADRSALYREIARANNRPDWEPNVRETFARVWVEEAPSGYWYQDARGNWQRK
ncbi:hypothetical protein TVNIR_2191 [Thioalkalivibrio nitratireducens DSM 14787]|uniref:DUF1318 domain-containing protein n=1 Tax=Thioalkalivibrio nitratireducens (strain DSM 14787 / UNIQEM 213 / ALEN2) TaxID=1255043 RepID=L0DXV6_THIND|nr:YdbL family protein [Thioalkalivibrio nitratireducens]AGA33847.1 hypothetical protein TVNIR_2191 [Thioalkalivibrio nitratireducens DSM 14787]